MPKKKLLPDITYSFTESYTIQDYVKERIIGPDGEISYERIDEHGGTSYYRSEKHRNIAEYCLVENHRGFKNDDVSDLKILEALLEQTVRGNNEKPYHTCNIKSLLIQFQCVENVYWSMLFYREEWETNGLQAFRQACIENIESDPKLNSTFNAEWLRNKIQTKYSQFSSIQKTFIIPSWVVLAGALLGAALLTLMVYYGQLSLISTIYAGVLFGALFGGAGVHYMYENRKLNIREEEEFASFCQQSRQILLDKNVHVDDTLGGIVSEDPRQFLRSERQRKSIFNCCSLFTHKPERDSSIAEASTSHSK